MRSVIGKSWILLPGLVILLGFSVIGAESDFQSRWPAETERAWAGPDYWTNPLPDWRVSGGRLECWRSGGDRNVYLLSRELDQAKGSVSLSVTFGQLDPTESKLDDGWVGFKVASRGEFNDYRDSAVRGDGLNAGLTTYGHLFIGGQNGSGDGIAAPLNDIRLQFDAEPSRRGFTALLAAYDKDGRKLSEMSLEGIDPDWLTGHLALVASSVKSPSVDLSKARPKFEGDPNRGRGGEGDGGNVRIWFKDWTVSGSKVRAYPERAWGPVLFTQYTLNRQVMKLTAHMAPVGNGSRTATLEVCEGSTGGWKQVDEAVIDPLARTAAFRVSNWDDDRDWSYRVVYPLTVAEGKTEDKYYSGTIRKDPVDKEQIVVAAITGNNDFGFPHADVARNLAHHRPDFLAYTGDQLYERTGGYGLIREPVNLAALDYLRRWYMFGWEYGELLRDIPSVCLPDDHDVFHGNVWGAGGIAARAVDGHRAIDCGGYLMAPVWVNMIQRTQTSHMADAFDPTPVEQGIGVYYGEMSWGGISFAVIEDRKWKSSPTTTIPEANIINGWAQSPDYKAARDGDVAGATLLGKRQLDFLDKWAVDWSGGVWMKAVISQTLFCNLATLPPPATGDDVTPKLRVNAPGEYAEGEVKVSDHDSNGWPQTGRNKALKRMRKGFAFHISGDQHLGSTLQYGIEDWGDAGFAACVPAIANVWPRRWFPPEAGANQKPGSPKYTGDFLDGFGNKVSVYAVSNPHSVGVEPTWINHRAPGYGIVKFDRNSRKIEIECWPRWVDATKPDAEQYPGWPVVIDQTDNYGRAASAWLPTVKVSGMNDPVVRVIEEISGETVYALRIKGNNFRPKVFARGKYTIVVGEPGTDRIKKLEGIGTVPGDVDRTLEVKF